MKSREFLTSFIPGMSFTYRCSSKSTLLVAESSCSPDQSHLLQRYRIINGEQKMRSLSPRKRHATLFLLIGMWLGYVTPSYADSGNFAGIYHLQNVVDGGDQVSATFVMQTFNNSTADVADATIKLVEGPFLPVVTDMTYEALAIPGGSNAVIQGDITIPKDLYNQWLDGLMPYALIQYVDASGARLQYPIEVTGGGL